MVECTCDVCDTKGEVVESTDLVCLGCYDKVTRLLKWVYDNMGSVGWCAMREKEGADDWAKKTKETLKDVI